MPMNEIQMRLRDVSAVTLLPCLLMASIGGCDYRQTTPATSPLIPKSAASQESNNDSRTESGARLSDTQSLSSGPSPPSPSGTSDPPVSTKAIAQSIVVGPSEQQLAKWNLVNFEPLRLLAYREHDGIGYVSFVSMVQGGQEYLLGGNRLTLWSLKDSSQVHDFIGAKVKDNEQLLCFAVAPDGTWGVVGDAGGLLHKFDIVGRKMQRTKQTNATRIVHLAISPDGKEIAMIPRVSEITVWDAETFEKKSSFKVDAREITHLQYTAPGILIAAGETMASWDTSTGAKLTSFPSERHQSAIALSPDSKQLVFGSTESLTRWSLVDDKASGQYRGVPFRSGAIRFCDDGSLMAIATSGTVHIMDASTGRQLQVIDASGSAITDACWIPKSQMVMVATDMGENRIWGRTEEIRALGIEPLSTPEVDTRVDGNEPASVAQNLAVMDLRALPTLPDATPHSSYFHSVYYSAPSEINEAITFYRYVLTQRGWNEVTGRSGETDLLFSKQGYLLQLTTHSSQAAETYIYLTFLGNHDLTKLPRYSPAKSTTRSVANSVAYSVDATLLQVEMDLLRRFHADGWTHVVRLASRQHESESTRSLEFIKSGTVVRVMVQPDTTDAKLLNIDYSQFLSANLLPVPKDAGVMEWDDYQACQMVANTGLSIDEATSFYEGAMAQQGWIAREKGGSKDEHVVYLPYYRGQQDVTVALKQLDDGLVRIRTGAYSDHSWQKPELEKGPDDTATHDENGETDVDDDRIEAADMPVLHVAGAASYDAATGRIRFTLDRTPLIEVAKEYETELAKLGWTARPFGDPTEKAVNIHFEKDSTTIYYQSSVDPTGESIVHLSGTGLKWTKPIASTQLISYASWLRNQNLPASLRSLDQYNAQMSKLEKK